VSLRAVDALFCANKAPQALSRGKKLKGISSLVLLLQRRQVRFVGVKQSGVLDVRNCEQGTSTSGVWGFDQRVQTRLFF